MERHWHVFLQYQSLGGIAIGRSRRADAGVQARIANRLGLALYQKGKWQRRGEEWQHDDKLLDEAIVDFRRTLEQAGARSNGVRFDLGVALLARSRDEEGIEALKACLAAEPASANVAEAKRFIADPRRAREAFAPDFSVTSLAGEPLSLEALKGKAVLIDFWPQAARRHLR